MTFPCDQNRLTSTNTPAEFANIKLLCCDCDGVMTDGGLYYDATGHVMAKFQVLDGLGLKRLEEAGTPTCLITMSKTGAIDKRAEVLGMAHCFTGCRDKLTTITRLCEELGITLGEVAHIADDINDLELLGAVGFPVTVPNAVDEVKAVCRYITARVGGSGAVRDLCDAILRAKAGENIGR